MTSRVSFLTGLSTTLALAAAVAITAAAQTPPDISFPVAELGNCSSQEACEAYCSEDEHLDACVDFGLRHDLFDEEEAKLARRVLREGGPGGCRGEAACRAYCEESAHANECVEFAIQEGLIPPEEAAIVKDVMANGGPGECRAREECMSYCSDPEHADECFAFAQKHGLVEPGEAELVREVMASGGPGGCKTKDACEAYCSDGNHVDACVDFALKHGLISEKEATLARRFGPNFTGPGGCQGEQACRTYCEDGAHMDACLDFAVEHGMMSTEEAAQAREHGGLIINEQGPGGCTGKECRDYCDHPDNAEECAAWAAERGMISEEDARRMMQTGPGGCRTPEECTAYCSDPAHANECGPPPSAHRDAPSFETYSEPPPSERGAFHEDAPGPMDDFNDFPEPNDQSFEAPSEATLPPPDASFPTEENVGDRQDVFTNIPDDHASVENSDETTQ